MEDRPSVHPVNVHCLLTLLEKQIDSLTPFGVWRVLGLSMSCIAIGDYLLHPMHIHLDPLYLLPIYLVNWRLTLRAGLAVSAIVAALSVGTDMMASGHMPPGAAGNLVLYTFSLALVAAIVSRLRASFERERAVALRDDITGALSRRAFEKQVSAVIKAASGRGQPLLLVYLDIDGFKAVNDWHGHEAGDLVLRHFGREGRAALKHEDYFGRMGGDEFALLVPLSAIEDAETTAEDLHRRLSEALASTGYQVTCSMGALALSPDDGASLDELLAKVDRLMYAAKNGGKDSLRFDVTAPGSETSLPLFAA